MRKLYKYLIVDCEGEPFYRSRLLLADLTIVNVLSTVSLLVARESFLVVFPISLLLAVVFNLVVGDYAWTYCSAKEEELE